MKRFTDDFDLNIAILQQSFQKEDTFIIRKVKNQHHPEIPIAVCFFDCMVDGDRLNRDIVAPLCLLDFDVKAENFTNEIAEAVLFASSQSFTDEIKKAEVQLCAGDCVVLAGNCAKVIILDIKGMPSRGIEQPDGEVSVAGPHEGFDENIMHNMSLIKKRLSAPEMKAEFLKVGERSHTAIALLYMDGIAKPEIVNRIREKVNSLSLDGVWDGNYILEMLQPKTLLLFPLCGKTQRPDVAAAKLCEGRVVLLVNGSPTALTLPFLFVENFQVADDYYLSRPYGNVGRLLRMFGFWLSFLVPAVYIALIYHHPAMMPGELMYSIAAAGRGVPIHSITEILLLSLVFETLRETGSRMPEAIGLALNIVGAIVLGQSAVDAGFVSAPMVIVVAFSGTVGLMVRELRGTVFFLRIAFIVAGAGFGLFGVTALTMMLWGYLHTLVSFGVEYMYTFSPLYPHAGQDVFARDKIPFMNFRQQKISRDMKRQGRV